MAVTVDEMKNYLRVDFEDDDALIGDLIRQGKQICMDVARIADEDEFEDLQGTKIAVQYAAAYLYEHREEADHHQLVMDLRNLLFGEENRDSEVVGLNIALMNEKVIFQKCSVVKDGIGIIGTSGQRITAVLLR